MKLTAAILFLILSSLPAYACCTGGNESNQTVCNESGENYADNPASGENCSSNIVTKKLSDCSSPDGYAVVRGNSSGSCSCNGICFCGCCPSTISCSLSSRQLVQYNSVNFAPFSTGIFPSSLRPVIIPPEC